MKARVTGDFGRDFLVELEDRTQLTCVRKGRKQDVACGDIVDVILTSPGNGRIERVETRRNVLFRADAWREKTLAANIDQVIIIIAPRPTFSEPFLNLCLVACEAAQIAPKIVLNKNDLPEFEAARSHIAHLENIGYPILSLSAKHNIEPLRPHLEGKITLLVGQSGMGKSKTVNNLVMRDVAREGEFSEALDSGKHTTTYTRLYWLEKNTAIIDTPGLQSFGLFHLSDNDIAECMPEFRPYIGHCRFYNCLHLGEPGCAIVSAAEQRKIDPTRLVFYQVLIEQQRSLRQANPDWKR
ncbi:MAG: ribosome small subunit-dependent GTPase A [Betaproteobacteria bacterium]|nr:ribosome small subunit-dependent GTPase A [Betaproteobacteria bacterium]